MGGQGFWSTMVLGPKRNLVIHHLADLSGLFACALYVGLERTTCRDTRHHRIPGRDIHLRGCRFPATPNPRYSILIARVGSVPLLSARTVTRDLARRF